MKHKHIISEMWPRIAALLLSICSLVTFGIQANAAEPTWGSSTGDAIVTFTVQQADKPEVYDDNKEDTPIADTEDKENNDTPIIPTNPKGVEDKEITPALEEKVEESPIVKSGKPVIVKKDSEEISQVSKVEAPKKSLIGRDTKKLIKEAEVEYRIPKKPGIPWPLIIGIAAAGIVTVGVGASGGFSALWVLLLGLLFRKKKKCWSGLLSYVDNWATKVTGDITDVEDMQDILDKGVLISELRTYMESTGVKTILPVNTKMSIDIEGSESVFDADEELFFEFLDGKKGHCTVTFYNGAAKLCFAVTMDLF